MKLLLLIVAVLAVLVLGSIAGCRAVYTSSRDHVTLTVKEKAPSNDDSPYRVFTTDNRTFSVQDSHTYWDFRASDRWGALTVGATYDCLTEGWRFGFLSSYPNLLSCEPVQR